MTQSINVGTRRRFLKQAAGAGLAMGVGPWLQSCGFSDNSPQGGTELRTHYFDLSNADPSHDYYLVAGDNHHSISRITSEQRATQAGLLLQAGNDRFTHFATAALPTDAIQMCYVKGIDRAAGTSAWTMPLMFYHVPAMANAVVGKALAACGKTPASLQFASMRKTLEQVALAGLGIGQAHAAEPYNYCADPDYADYKDYFDQAIALVCHHPEIGSFDAATLAYVQQNIICAHSAVLNLAVSIYQQGSATTAGGWAKLIPVLDPATGQPTVDENGHFQYFVQHSRKTLEDTGAAIRAILPLIKNDPVLGANITGVLPDQDNKSLRGKLWVVNNGTQTQESTPANLQAPALAAAGLTAGSTITWQLRNLSKGSGYSVHSLHGNDDRTVSFTVSNWFLRFLGLYIRYLDGAGKPIRYSDLPSDTKNQFRADLCNTYDCFLELINEETVILGVPVKQETQRFTISIPEMATSFEILASGVGHGESAYPETLVPGTFATILMDLAIPGLFLIQAASAAYEAYYAEVAASKKLVVDAVKLLILDLADNTLDAMYDDPELFINMAPALLACLSDTPLGQKVAKYLTRGKASNGIGVGFIIQATVAASLGVQIAETLAEVANAPRTYVNEVTVTHPIKVTINHDPKDVAGFPATATHYRLYAVCDGSTPRDSGPIQMQTTTRTEPITYTFPSLPSGGKVNITACFYSVSGWLCGVGSTGSIDNTQDQATITIEEKLVPLSSSTVYSHKQKTALDTSGRHVWKGETAPPLVQKSCDNASGHLCDLVGITLSESFGAIGYAWRASSAKVRNFANQASGQLYQFANMSFTQDPESGYKFSGAGFSTPARLAYDRASPTSHNFYIDSSTGASIVRRIVMTAVDTPPAIDLPNSNLAVGKFNFASDGFLIHPSGKLISINTALSKFEVLEPAKTAVADAKAPLAQAYSGPGTRDGLLLGPVCTALTPGGEILIVEQMNNRIQAFDTGANPIPIFAGGKSSYMPLKATSTGTSYMDLAVEPVGYIYVLSVQDNVYTLDLYDPQGNWLSATKGVNAGKLTIDLFRNIYTLNFETLTPIGDVTEPSVSQWIPSTPSGTGT